MYCSSRSKCVPINTNIVLLGVFYLASLIHSLSESKEPLLYLLTSTWWCCIPGSLRQRCGRNFWLYFWSSLGQQYPKFAVWLCYFNLCLASWQRIQPLDQHVVTYCHFVIKVEFVLGVTSQETALARSWITNHYEFEHGLVGPWSSPPGTHENAGCLLNIKIMLKWDCKASWPLSRVSACSETTSHWVTSGIR